MQFAVYIKRLGKKLKKGVEEMDWRAKYNDIIVSADEAVKCIKSGDMIMIQQAHATSYFLLDALARRADELEDISIMCHNLWQAPSFLGTEYERKFHLLCNFLDKGTRPAYKEGKVDFVPVFYHDMPKYYREINRPDVFFVMLTPPDENGYCSYALNADYSCACAEAAKIIIAQINPSLPRTYGAKISMDDLTWVVEHDEPMEEMKLGKCGEIEKQIAAQIAPFIKDGACLQLGIGGVPDAVLSWLKDKKHLGVHSELLSDGIVELYEAGAIDNSMKTVNKGKFVVNFLIGTKKLFDFVDNNPDVLVLPVDYVNDPWVIGQNENVVSINSCLQVDLLGQVDADTISGKLYSGIGGQVDFVRGARLSKGGLSFIALPSTAKNSTISRIIPHLETGTPTTTSRHDVQYICTEYGAVNLYGRTVRERAELLISIAHPNFRDALRAQARAEGLV